MKFSLLFIFLLSATVAGAQFNVPTFSAGDSIFVWAKDGLSLRTEPSSKSSKKRALAYGTPGVVVESGKYDSVTVITAATDKEGHRTSAFRIHGRWVRVHAEQDTGYVFSGYLSEMEPYKRKNGEHASISAWLEQTAGKLSTREYQNGNTIAYTNHVVESKHNGEGGGYTRYYFPRDKSFHDGFLLLNYFYDLHISKEEVAECVWFNLTQGPDLLEIVSSGLRGGLNSMVKILFLDGFLIIEWGGWC